ncbi:MAG: PD40 domain-containing protein, partial [Nitrospiraceae bacterium]
SDAPPAGTPPSGGAGSTTTRVSLGSEANNSSFTPSISSDGRFIAFASDATNLVGPNDTNGVRDVFVRDTVNSTTSRVSLHNDGNQRTDPSSAPSISSDGRYVAFQSDSPLTANDTNGVTDVFVRDTTGSTTMRASVSTSGMQGSASSLLPSISADGRHISFESNAPNLVTDDFNGVKDIFVRSQ